MNSQEINYQPQKETVMSEAQELEAQKQIVEQAKAYIEKNIVKADNSATKCVDGRYKQTEATGALSFAGADLGTAMGLLTQINPQTNDLYTPQEAFETVRAFCKSENRKFCWHSGGHEGHHGVIVDCGHCNAAIQEFTDKYGIPGEKVQELLDIIRKAQEEFPDEMECVVLEGDHAEQAILLVQNQDVSVYPMGEDGQQYFIYDQARHGEMIERFIQYLKLPEDNTLAASLTEQTMATLGVLGSSKGKYMLSVTITDPEQKAVEVTVLQKAPDYTVQQ